MDEQVLHSLQWIESMPSWVMFAFFFFSAFMENVFPPYPGDTILAFSGFLAARGVMSLPIVFFAGFAGSARRICDVYAWTQGSRTCAENGTQRFARPAWLKNSLHEAVSQESIEKTGLWFNRYGLYFVIVSIFCGSPFFCEHSGGNFEGLSAPLHALLRPGCCAVERAFDGGRLHSRPQLGTRICIFEVVHPVFIIVAVVAVAGFVFWKWRSSNIH